MNNKPVLESKIETYLKDQVKALGGLAFKFKSSVNGVPDQIIMMDGVAHFVEVKRPGQKPRADQVNMQNKIIAQGIPVHNVSTHREVDDFIRITLKHKPVELSKRPKSSTAAKPKIKGFGTFK